MAKSVLITGGLGFLGTHLADDFHRRGWKVRIVDDRRAAVVGWAPDPSMEVIEESVEDFCGTPRAYFVKDDLVIHAASPVGPAGILGLAGDIIPRIVEPTRVITEACAINRVPLIHISTSEVYNASGINAEDDDLIAPADPCARGEYAVGKIAAEYIVRQRSRLDDFPALVVRPFNIAGARQPREKGFVVPTFVEQAMAGEPMTVFGKGDQQRAFMSVRDFCRLMAVVSETPTWQGRVVNAGNPGNLTDIVSLATRIGERVGGYAPDTPRIKYADGNEVHGPEWREAAGYHKIPGPSWATNYAGWEPKDNLDAIIDATAAEFSLPLAA